MKRRIVKVGGSLLRRVDLPSRFASWLERQTTAEQTYVVVGGGTLVDEIRKFDQRFQLSDESAHWLAIRGLSVTAQLFAELVSGAKLVHARAPIDQNGLFVLDVYEFLRRPEVGGSIELPRGWHVTSDSIAAHVAKLLQADELVMLKAAKNRFDSVVDAAAAGFVDSYFPTAVAECESARFDVV